MRLFASLTLTGLLASPSSSSRAQEAAFPGRVTGRVVDAASRRPGLTDVASATGANVGTMSGVNGRFA